MFWRTSLTSRMHQMKVRKEVYKRIHQFSPTLDSILLLGCQQLDSGSNADDANDDMIEWKHKVHGESFTIELDKNDVYNDTYHFFGINDETLQKLRTEMTSTTMPKRAKQSAFEIPAVAIKSKDVPVVIMAGEGVSIIHTTTPTHIHKKTKLEKRGQVV